MSLELGGISPTMEEIGQRMGISRQRVQQICLILRAHGYVTYERYRHRSLRVVEAA